MFWAGSTCGYTVVCNTSTLTHRNIIVATFGAKHVSGRVGVTRAVKLLEAEVCCVCAACWRYGAPDGRSSITRWLQQDATEYSVYKKMPVPGAERMCRNVRQHVQGAILHVTLDITHSYDA